MGDFNEIAVLNIVPDRNVQRLGNLIERFAIFFICEFRTDQEVVNMGTGQRPRPVGFRGFP